MSHSGITGLKGEIKMLCPKCLSKTIICSVHVNMKIGEKYRLYMCKNKDCKHKFYTIECHAAETTILKRKIENAVRTR